jgi:secondary thiamine-phosphate synthase enzyme
LFCSGLCCWSWNVDSKKILLAKSEQQSHTIEIKKIINSKPPPEPMHEITISTGKKQQIIDITGKVTDAVKNSGVKQGICHVFVAHATAAIIINENYDPNVCADIINALDKLVPQGIWLHDSVDNNGAAHIKSSILGPSETLPIKNSELQLGQWQSIMLCDFDGPRQRKIYIQIIKGD